MCDRATLQLLGHDSLVDLCLRLSQRLEATTLLLEDAQNQVKDLTPGPLGVSPAETRRRQWDARANQATDPDYSWGFTPSREDSATVPEFAKRIQDAIHRAQRNLATAGAPQGAEATPEATPEATHRLHGADCACHDTPGEGQDTPDVTQNENDSQLGAQGPPERLIDSAGSAWEIWSWPGDTQERGTWYMLADRDTKAAHKLAWIIEQWGPVTLTGGEK